MEDSTRCASSIFESSPFINFIWQQAYNVFHTIGIQISFINFIQQTYKFYETFYKAQWNKMTKYICRWLEFCFVISHIKTHMKKMIISPGESRMNSSYASIGESTNKMEYIIQDCRLHKSWGSRCDLQQSKWLKSYLKTFLQQKQQNLYLRSKLCGKK